MRHGFAGLTLGVLFAIGCGDGGVTGPPATATVSGVVREEGSGVPVAGANVSLAGVTATSSANGAYQLQNVPVGAALSLAVSAPGYDALTQTVQVKAGTNSVDVALTRNGLYPVGNYLVYLPPGVTQYRGVFVAMMGGTVDTRPLLRDDLAYYQSFPLAGDVSGYRQHMLAFAAAHGFAVIGAAFGAQSRGPAAFANLMNAVSTVGNQSGHPELANVSFVLHGHSSTACFAYEFAVTHPDRTVGFIVAKSSCRTEPGAATGVPGYFFFGENDPQLSAGLAFQMRVHVEANRARGALWAYAIEPGAGHAQVADQDLLFDWLSTIVALRLPANASAVQPINETAGWLGDHTTYVIASHPCFATDKSTASWLPSVQTAHDWQALVSKGAVTTTITC